MDIKYMLCEYIDINSTVQDLNEELNFVVSKKSYTQDNIKAQVIDDMPRGTDVGNPTLQAVCKNIDCYQKRIDYLCNRINELLEIKTTVERALQVLDTDEKRLIDLKYFKKFKMKEIQYEMKYSRTCVYEIYNRAMNKLAEITECKTA